MLRLLQKTVVVRDLSTRVFPSSFSSHLAGVRKTLSKRCFSTSNEIAIRNVAIIAHVDHGKTSLVDKLLTQSGIQNISERVMDSNPLEKERGITILAKNTSMKWKDYKINIVDTPGHGDFGGEVERIMSMVNGVVLVVDAHEGPMAQTKFVLSKALKAKLKPIVVLNKMDRKEGLRVDETENELFDLFASLEANDEQLNYPTLYASAYEGWAIRNRGDEKVDMAPLLDAIVKHVPPPEGDANKPFTMLISSIDSDVFLGRILTGRIMSGSVKTNTPLYAVNQEGKIIETGKVMKIVARDNHQKVILEEGKVGDIVGIAGFEKSTVTTTLGFAEDTKPIPTIPIDPPVMSMTFAPNSSPISGKEGTQHTFAAIKRRIEKEMETNVSLSYKQSTKDAIEVYGRGELHLGILIENMRREGFELSISPPEIVFRYNEKNEKLEPLEDVTIDVDEKYSGRVIDIMTLRKADFVDMKTVGGKTRITFKCPSRTLIGIRNELLTETRGTAIYNHIFDSYVPYKGRIEYYKRGAIISMEDGMATSYALVGIEPRGTLFIKPGMKVYQGMIIGEHSKEGDLEVNPVRSKQLTNFRTVQKEDSVRLTPPKLLTLEEAMANIKYDELLEVTPTTIRLRKAVLDPNQRKKEKRASE